METNSDQHFNILFAPGLKKKMLCEREEVPPQIESYMGSEKRERVESGEWRVESGLSFFQTILGDRFTRPFKFNS